MSGTLILGIVGGAIVVGLLTALMSGKSWPMSQIITMALLFLATTGFLFLAILTLTANKNWRELHKRQVAELTSADLRLREAIEGSRAPGAPPSKGVAELRREYALLANNRGSALFDVALTRVDAGVLEVDVKRPNHGLTAGSILFLFDSRPPDQGGKYLGEFMVSAADDKNVKLDPIVVTPQQAQGLVPGGGPLALYATMPIDDLEVPANMNEPDTRKRVAYDFLFREHFTQSALVADSIQKRQINQQRIDAATKSLAAQAKDREEEIANLKLEVEKFEFEQQTLANYQKVLEKRLTDLNAAMRQAFDRNRNAAEALRAQQMQALEGTRRAQASPAPGPVTASR